MNHFFENNCLNLEQASGMLVGLAVGDALGTYLEFGPSREPENYLRDYKEGGPFRLPAGSWTDDTSMALAMADALDLSKGEFDGDLIMRNWIDWYDNGAFSSTGECFDIGNTCAAALNQYRSDMDINTSGATSPNSAGNGALMRMAPVIIAAKDETQAVDWALRQTKLTHACAECQIFSEAFARELWRGETLEEYEQLRIPVATPREKVLSGGYVKESYQCAWWAIQNSNNFEDAVILAINRGHDADTCGAICGQLAGRIYGYSNIPERWITGLFAEPNIRNVAKNLWRLAIGKQALSS